MRRQPHSFATVILLAFTVATTSFATSADPFPEISPTTRSQAVHLLRDGASSEIACLTPHVDLASRMPRGTMPATRRALELLGRGITFAPEETLTTGTGITIRFTNDPSSFDRVRVPEPGQPPRVLRSTWRGLDTAHRFLVDLLELPGPESLDVLLVELGDDLDGYTVNTTGRSRSTRLVLDASPRLGPAGARRSAIHQYAHAVAHAMNPAFPAEWAEAFATWTVLRLDAQPDAETARRVSQRLARLDEGLLTPDPALAAGNAVWFSFVEESYGMAAVRSSVEELARGNSVTGALDRAIRRVSTDDLAAAFREFHLWTVLVGRRSDEHHLPYATRLTPPAFASNADTLPALSVQSDSPVAPLGATQIRLAPESVDGGLSLYFEGEFSGRWEADLLLVDDRGALRRLALTLSPEGRGESTVPLHDLAEAILLVRNIGPNDGAPASYTYAAHREPRFPFAISSLDARAMDAGGVLVSWETTSERRLVGYNVLRDRGPGTEPTTINPVWVPALGEAGLDTSYQFVDSTAEAGVAYTYRIQGITTDGLSGLSGPAVIHRPIPERP